MKIILTLHAIARLQKLSEKYREHSVFIIYEVGGCGSELDGLFRLLFVRNFDDRTVSIQTNWRPVYVNESTLLFMDQEMVIDYTSGGYVVKSANQIYSHPMPIEIEP
ncbi:iron-sulfur cluster biosynthesis family protein [Bacillus sp. FJAT-47783]|uniref:iron-sulfur cluster biosynthesis family protein n=1 Tax=Bacillus sp. FJAT-47783 TaxID=2922712 RepID=UPI001FAE0EA3|nr:iron-sulfur cluster biosynthesis family protein [Bacillus sp. FJAT-47783]